MGQRLGQHFLHSPSVLQKIAAAVCPAETPLVIEIGPGHGALTQHLLAAASRLVAIELDPLLAEELRRRYAGNDRVTIVEADVLSVDLAQWGPAVIAGNLPYYITSPILDRTLRSGPACLRAVFLMQKEVALRLTAQPGSRDYGFLTVRTQSLAHPRRLLTVRPGAFDPPPKVDSAVVELTPHAPPCPDVEDFLRFAGWCFEQKRKTLRNNLAKHFGTLSEGELPEGRLRAEQLTVAQLAALWERLRGRHRGASDYTGISAVTNKA
ncbi:MAG: ribosomal RNA small subunit methyltransferase A [Bryobacterales bacterium]|nr:ribosomal RNA small subunit methyltransferase A [Bryobacterales bacterium]